jgi:hypothetical protein
MSKGEEFKNQICKASAEARGACILFMPAPPSRQANRLGYRPMPYVICCHLKMRRQKLNKILAVAKLRNKLRLE